MGDTKITLRINEVELDEIDDFVARHPEYHNRSQLIRHAVMEYMKMVERGEFNESKKGFCVEMNDRLTTILEEYVEYRYFGSLDELMSYVLKTITSEGILGKILKNYVHSVPNLRLDEEEYKEERVVKRR